MNKLVILVLIITIFFGCAERPSEEDVLYSKEVDARFLIGMDVT